MKKVSIGDSVSGVVDSDGHLYTWGINNTVGQLGRETASLKGEDAQMPQLVEFLSGKIVN